MTQKENHVPSRRRSILLSITEPTLVNGVVLGIVLSIVAALIWNLEFVRSTILFLISAVVIFSFGALAASSYLRRRSREIQESINEFQEQFAETDEAKLVKLFSQDQEQKALAVSELLTRVSSGVFPLLQSIVAIGARVFAFGRLFAVLGVVISLAIFFATYLQVDRLTEQNRLLRLDSLASFQRVAAELRTTIGNAQAMSSIARELSQILNDDLAQTKDTNLVNLCARATLSYSAILQQVLASRDNSGAVEKEQEENEACATELGRLLDGRSSAIESSRLTSLGFSGGRPFTRDLAEQFLSQFPSVCGTDPAITTLVARDWRALMSLQEGFYLLNQVLEHDPEVELLTASDSPLETLVDPIETFLSDINEDHKYRSDAASDVSFHSLHIAVASVSVGVNDYLSAQIKGCDGKATQTLSILDQLEKESVKLVEKMIKEQDK